MEDFGRSLLVLGGARSGKSRHGQALAEAAAGAAAGMTRGRLVYLATAQAFDDEMTDRIARHRSDRDGRWRTVEAPLDLTGAIVAADGDDAVLLVDCLTLWVSNLLLADADVAAAGERLCAALPAVRGRVILIANETGLGIVPDNALARRFRDAAGLLNQRIARAVDRVDLVVAGLARRWK